jgi:hypothetical protein
VTAQTPEVKAQGYARFKEAAGLSRGDKIVSANKDKAVEL